MKRSEIFNLVVIFLLGISSGLPLLLLLSTLNLWMADAHISNAQIGALTICSGPYMFKFLIAPILDTCRLPGLCALLGKRRSFLLFSQMGLIATIMLLSRISPSEHFTLLTICAFMVGIFAATQDAAIEAYRIEIMPKHYLGYVMMISTLGFRLGMLTSGAFAVYLAIYVPWSEVYSYMSMAVGVGVFATLIGPRELYTNTRQIVGFVEKIKDFWENSIVFAKSHNFALIFAFIFFYKMGDSAVNAVSMQFLQNTGFDKIEISGINRTFGILMMIFGSFCGGIFIQKTSVQYALKACSVALIVGSLLYMRQAMLGYDPMFLYVSTGGHNFIVGLSQTALITYMSSLCNPALGNTATQYAIVASVGSMSRIIIGALACRIADHVSWDVLFMIISCACVPTLFLQSWRRKEMSPA